MNATGWIGNNVPGVSTGRCTPFCPPPSMNVSSVGEVLELRLVDRALGADRQRRADLRDHDADLARGHLHPRELLHAEDRPQLEPQPGREQLGLEAGLAVERDRVVGGQLLEREPLLDEPDLDRSDRVERLQARSATNSEQRDENDDDDGHFDCLL